METIIIIITLIGIPVGISMVVNGNSAGWYCAIPGLAILMFVAFIFVTAKKEDEKDQVIKSKENDKLLEALEIYNNAKKKVNIPRVLKNKSLIDQNRGS